MRVLVTGATGFVGAHSARALQDGGHELRLLVRDAAKIDRVATATSFTAEDVVVGDVTDRSSVEASLKGCDAVLHAAGAVSLNRARAAEVMAVNEAAARHVLRLAADRGLARIVHVSSTSALSVTPGRPLTVDAPVATGGGYARSKAAAEHIARELGAAGAPVSITYPSGVLGPAAGESLGETSISMARFVAAGVMPTPRGAISVLDVRDLAEVHRLLLEPGDQPARVMCGGTLVTMRELGRHLAALTGRRFPVLPVPPAVLRLAGSAADRVARVLRVDVPLTEESMTLITTWAGTADTALADLGVPWRPVEAALASAIQAWLTAGLLTQRQVGTLASADHGL